MFRRIAIAIVVVLVLPASAIAAPGWLAPAANVSTVSGVQNPTQIATNARGDTVIVWATGFGSGPIFWSERPAGGSFTVGAQITMAAGQQLGASGVSIDSAGTMYVFLITGSGSNNTIQPSVATKAIGASTWTVTPIEAAGIVGGSDAPNPPISGVVAPNGQGVAIFEFEHISNFLSSHFVYSVKQAGSSAWSAPAAVPGSTGGGVSVRLATDATGDVAALFGLSPNPNIFGATLAAGGT